MRRRASTIGATLVVLALAPVAPPLVRAAVDRAQTTASPIVSVWYRGTAEGQPDRNELAVIRAIGFTGIVWPTKQTSGLPVVRQMAAGVGLSVSVRPVPRPLSAAAALEPGEHVDIVMNTAGASAGTALAWRALAHGARAIAFDAGAATGAGLSETSGALAPWVEAARGFARQVSANATLLGTMRPGPAVAFDGPHSPTLDVVLLDAGRAWLLVATSTAPATVEASVRLTPGVPSAIWVSLIDGRDMSMINQPAGPLWRLSLEAGGARVFVNDKGHWP